MVTEMLPFQTDDDPEEWLFEEAVRLFQAGDDADAKALFEQCAARNGLHAAEARACLERIRTRADRLLFADAVRLSDLGHLEQARVRFREVIRLAGEKAAEARQHIEKIDFPGGGREARGQPIEERRAPMGAPVMPVFRRREEVPASAELAENVAHGEDLVRRTPHVDYFPPSPVKPEATFEVRVYSDRDEARAGEKSEEMVLEAPPEIVDFPVRVRLLVTSHFVINGKDLQVLLIERDQERSEIAKFSVTVKSKRELEALASEPPSIIALFTYNGRPSGRVLREIAIDGLPAAAPMPPSATSELSLDANAITPDLTIVIAATRENDNRHFWCTVQTPLLDTYRNGVGEEWNLPDTTYNIVNGFMQNFTTAGATKLMRISALKGAGRRLFEASPQIFQKAFWSLVDADKLPKSIAIISSEPYIPWELMIPRREIGEEAVPETRKPLGVEFTVGRWTGKNLATARQKIPIANSYALAPSYTGSRKLPFAQVEAQFIIDNFSGAQIAPATFEGFDAALQAQGRTLLHIACHGTTSATGQQAIQLENNQTLDSNQVLGLEGVEAGFRAKRPFVFVNACEVGRPVPALVGIGGFAQSFIEIGASAVIAPLWSVKDSIAHQIAQDFYQTALAHPEVPFAEILKQTRAKAYDPGIGEDTYAAYCFYGDPLASRQV